MREPTFTKLPQQLDISAIVDLLVSLEWGSRHEYDEADVRAMFDNSDYYAVAESDGRIVGYIRALSDRVNSTWISEIVVHPEHQRQGLGSGLLRGLIEEFGHTSIYAEALAGSERFFERHGIRPRPGKLIACSRAPGGHGSGGRRTLKS